MNVVMELAVQAGLEGLSQREGRVVVVLKGGDKRLVVVRRLNRPTSKANNNAGLTSPGSPV